MMPQTIAAKKEKGLEDLFKDYVPQQLEEQSDVQKTDSKFDLLFNRFEWSLKHKKENLALRERRDLEHWLGRREITLTPSEINTFLQASATYETDQNTQYLTGPFVSALIQRSYLAGHNNFWLDTSSLLPIHHLAFRLQGQKQKPLLLDIKGNVGKHFASKSLCIDGSLQGNAQYECASSLYYSNLTISGDVGSKFADGAFWSLFKIDGALGSSRGYDYIQHYCTFKTANERTLRSLLEEIYVANKICFIDEMGAEHVKCDFK